MACGKKVVLYGGVSTARRSRPRIARPLDAKPAEKRGPVAMASFMNDEGWEWRRIAAGGTMVMLPMLYFSILVRKFLVRGLTAGALKG
jgi:ABC-type maltose transport system permease subunit